MACTFTVDFPGAASQVVSSIKNKVEAQGGIFNGDTSAGNFEIPLFGSHIAGSYTIAGQQINLNITDKPFIISCKQIIKFIEGNLL